MRVDVVLPESHWEGVDAGVQALVDCWLVEPGGKVEAGQAVVRIVLVKSSIDVQAPAAGTLSQVLVRAGDNFARGQPLGRIDS